MAVFRHKMVPFQGYKNCISFSFADSCNDLCESYTLLYHIRLEFAIDFPQKATDLKIREFDEEMLFEKSTSSNSTAKTFKQRNQ